MGHTSWGTPWGTPWAHSLGHSLGALLGVHLAGHFVLHFPEHFPGHLPSSSVMYFSCSLQTHSIAMHLAQDCHLPTPAYNFHIFEKLYANPPRNHIISSILVLEGVPVLVRELILRLRLITNTNINFISCQVLRTLDDHSCDVLTSLDNPVEGYRGEDFAGAF